MIRLWFRYTSNRPTALHRSAESKDELHTGQSEFKYRGDALA